MHNLIKVLFAVALFVSATTPQLTAQTVGGFKAVETDDERVWEAAERAVAIRMANNPEGEETISLVNVLSAERQVVQGLKYRIKMHVLINDYDMEVTVVIFQSLKREFTLMSWQQQEFEASEEEDPPVD